MTDPLRKAAEMALEALEDYRFASGFERPLAQDAIDALRRALAQPEQRPVGTYEGVMETMLSLRKGTLEQQQIYTHMKDKLLYTAPPKREWVGLTDEDRSDLLTQHHGWNEFGIAIEAKLKEKNT